MDCFICLAIFFHFGVLQCRLRFQPPKDVDTGWKEIREKVMGGWAGAVSRCKSSKKIGGVHTEEGTH